MPVMMRGLNPFDLFLANARKRLGIGATPDFRSETIQDENDDNDPNWQGPRQEREPQRAWQKAASIGAPGIGSRYLDDEAPKTTLGLIGGLLGPGRPKSVAAQDPYGDLAWSQNKGPMPGMLGTTAPTGPGPIGPLRGLLNRGNLSNEMPINAIPVGRSSTLPPEFQPTDTPVRPRGFIGHSNFEPPPPKAPPTILQQANSMSGMFGGDRTTGHFQEGSGGLSDVAAGRIQRHPMPQVAAPTQELPSVESNIDLHKFAQDLHQRINYEEPQSAQSDSGKGVKIGADVRSLGKVLGSSLYAGDIAKIATKELTQNSMDAVRHLGEHGNVDITLNQKDNYVQVKDNGRGLTKNELETVFTDLGSSGKRDDESAIGGFGLAKAAPLLGGEKVEVTTVAREADGNLYEHRFMGTPDQLLDGVNITTRRLPNDTTTGTTVRTYVPSGSSFYDARDFVDKLSENSFGSQGKITVHNQREWEDKPTPTQYLPNKLAAGADVTTLSGPSADVEIMIPKGTKYGPASGVTYHLLNNGMWQGQGRYGYQEVPGVPEKVLVNVKSKVPEGHADYPFTANRESLRGTAQDMVGKYIEDTIVKPARGKRVDELNRIYSGLPEMETGHTAYEGGRAGFPFDDASFSAENPDNSDNDLREDADFGNQDVTEKEAPEIPEAEINSGRTRKKLKFHVYDVGNKFTPSELKEVIETPEVRNLAADISGVLHHAMEVLGKTDWSTKLDKIGFIFDEKVKGIHIPAPGKGHSAILINPFSIMQAYSPDKASSSLLHVILHEIAHIPGGGHDEHFTIRLSEIYENFGAENAFKAQQQFLKTLTNKRDSTEYPEPLQEVLHRYEDARGRETTEDDPLRGTGISSKAPRTRKKQISERNKSNGIGTVKPLR
jgi:hypothetical protein